MPGPALRDLTPDWLKPENASVFDSPERRAARALAGWLGLTDPGQAVAAAAGPLMAAESKLEGPLGKVVERIGARARQLTGGFFSRVDEAAKQLPAKGAHANKVAAILKNNASAEELEYRGVSDWLKAQGNTPITPEKLGAYLEAHPAPFPQVTTHGGPNPKHLTQLPEGYYVLPLDNRPDRFTLVNREGVGRALDSGTYGAAVDEALVRLSGGEPVTTRTKWPQWTLPGGKDYRENLLTLPDTVGPRRAALSEEFDTIQRELVAADYGTLTPAQIMEQFGARSARADEILRELNATPASGTFQSGHFRDTPNVVVHTRSKTRRLPSGERGRFLEEVQSDWHQKAQDLGYQPTGTARAELEAQLAEAERVHYANADARHEALERLKWSGPRRGEPGYEPLFSAFEQAEEASKESWSTVERLRDALGAGVPDAPFKESWPELGLKQQLLEAAHDPHAEWLGFTTGQTQIERYPKLSTMISEVTLEPGMNGKPYLAAYDLQGQRVVNESLENERQVAEYVGRGTAKKLLALAPDAGGQRRLTDLNVDLGAGMREFYDRQLPRKLEKILGPLGGGPVEAGGVRVPARQTQIEVPAFSVRDQGGHMRGIWENRADAEAYLANPPEAMRGFLDPARSTIVPATMPKTVDLPAGAEPAWLARLTPELKRRIREEGLPLMQLVGGAALGGITLEELHRRRPPAPAGDWFDAQGAGTMKDLHTPQ